MFFVGLSNCQYFLFHRSREKSIFYSFGSSKGVKTIFTKAGCIVDLRLFSLQLTRSDDLDHLDLGIAKGSKQPESACCAISEKTFGKENILMASVPQKSVTLSSAVCMNIDQRTL